MKTVARIRRLGLRRATSLSMPAHVRVRTRPGRALVQENSWKLRPAGRTLISTVTLLGWTLWLLLFGLMLSAMAWTLGVWYVTNEWNEFRGFKGLSLFIENDWPIGIAFCLVFGLWATVRALVMRRIKKQRLLLAEQQAIQCSGQVFPVFADAAALQCLLCHHDERGDLQGVEEIRTGPSPAKVGTPLRKRAIAAGGSR